MRPPTAIALCLLCGCSKEDPPASPPAPVQPAVRATTRVSTPELAELRGHLDHGRLEAALAILDRARDAGPEEPLLRARAAALQGETLEALRLVETARAREPSDPSVWATAAEIYVVAGKLDAGWDEVRGGEAACGPAPELDRARGILWISRSGGAEKGLALLEGARARDPGLPFSERALSQAHLLCGKSAAAARKPALALEHARAAVAFDPEEVDARRFLAEALAAAGEFEGAIAELERLVMGGHDIGSELALLRKKAAFAALLARDRPRALAHFAAARKLGLTDEELSTGARLLREEAEAEVGRGVAAYERGEIEEAAKRFRAALELEPDLLQAQNHLAVVLMRQGDAAGAASLWRAVLETARAEKIELPEPVHLNLARALLQAGDAAGAERTLAEYLALEPAGPWAADTQALLARVARPGGGR